MTAAHGSSEMAGRPEIRALTGSREGAAVIIDRLLIDENALVRGIERAVRAQLGEAHRIFPAAVRIEQLRAGAAAGTAGVWRIQGISDQGASYSVVLKGLWLGETQAEERAELWGKAGAALWDPVTDPAHPFSALRELEFYESGLLAKPGIGGLRAADYYGPLSSSEGRQQHRVGLFLEDVQGKAGKDLSLTELLLVARRLGSMQGDFLLRGQAGEALTEPWLARGYQRELVRRTDAMVAESEPLWRDPATWQRPVLAPLLADVGGGKTLVQATMELWQQREEFLELFESLWTLTGSHQDAWYAQFILAPDAVAMIDPASFGVAPLGADIAKLAVETMVREMPSLEGCRALQARFYDAYVAGLAEAGVRTEDPRIGELVELGWSASMAATESYRISADVVRHGIRYEDTLRETGEGARRSSWGDRPVEDVHAFHRDRGLLLLEHARRARGLAAELGAVVTQPLPLRELVARRPAGPAATPVEAPAAVRHHGTGVAPVAPPPDAPRP